MIYIKLTITKIQLERLNFVFIKLFEYMKTTWQLCQYYFSFNFSNILKFIFVFFLLIRSINLKYRENVVSNYVWSWYKKIIKYVRGILNEFMDFTEFTNVIFYAADACKPVSIWKFHKIRKSKFSWKLDIAKLIMGPYLCMRQYPAIILSGKKKCIT